MKNIFKYFVTRQGDKMMVGDKELRFISMCDHGSMTTGRGNPDLTEFEQRDFIRTIKQMGGQAFRCHWIGIARYDDPEDVKSKNHLIVEKDGSVTFRESHFVMLDRMLQICNEEGVRVIIPFVGNKDVMGHAYHKKPQRFTGEGKFYDIGSGKNKQYKDIIRFVLNRTNTLTGVKYKDDKAILCWETGNELVSSPYKWVSDTAAFVKEIDSNHLFMDGRNAINQCYKKYPLFDDPNVDILSCHLYGPVKGMNWVQTIDAVREWTKGKRIFIWGESCCFLKVGFGATMSNAQTRQVLERVVANGTGGIMYWTLGAHQETGGFNYHDLKLFRLRWPGFDSLNSLCKDAAIENERVNIWADYGYKIQGLKRPALPRPDAPVLLTPKDVGHINWKGSVGARTYTIQRAGKADGTWETVVESITDAARIVKYDQSLWADTGALAGKQYFYRIRAQNETGQSPWSNVVGPVTVKERWLVDDLFDTKQIFTSKNVEVVTRFQAWDHAMIRRQGPDAGYLTYKAPDMVRARILAYGTVATNMTARLSFSASKDGKQWTLINPEVTVHCDAARMHKRFKQRFNNGVVSYQLTLPSASNYLRLTMAKGYPKELLEIGQVEIQYGAKPRGGREPKADSTQ